METNVPAFTPRRVAHRTHQERREETTGKLLDATIEALADVGYARTSVSEICSRAGVSHGALFCHFGSRLELIAAAAEEVGRRHLERLRAEFEPVEKAIGPESDTLARAVRFLDAAAHSRMNAVWHELLVASRTDEELRPAVRGAMGRYAAGIEATAAEHFGADHYDPVHFRSAVWALICIFDGLALGSALDFRDANPRGDIVRLAPGSRDSCRARSSEERLRVRKPGEGRHKRHGLPFPPKRASRDERSQRSAAARTRARARDDERRYFRPKRVRGGVGRLPNFADRINLFHRLKPLDLRDTRMMIRFRLEKSANTPKKLDLFTLPAICAIYRATGGFPRKIINLCHQCVLTMIIQNKPKVTYGLVQRCAWRMFAAEGRRRWRVPAAVLAAGSLAAVLLWS